jgi:tetratricopeptide (TPR) repeat protein
VQEGRQSAALGLFEEALAAFDEAADLRAVTGVLGDIAAMLADLGLLERAEARMREALANSDRMGLGNLSACSLANLAQVLAYLGRYSEGRAAAEAAVEMSRAQGDSRMEGVAELYLALILQRISDGSEPEDHARRALRLLENVPPLVPAAHAALARALLQRGKTEEGANHAVLAGRLLSQLGYVEDGEALIRLVLVEALAAIGRTAEAREALRTALARLGERTEAIENPVWRSEFRKRIPDHAATIELGRKFGTLG